MALQKDWELSVRSTFATRNTREHRCRNIIVSLSDYLEQGLDPFTTCLYICTIFPWHNVWSHRYKRNKENKIVPHVGEFKGK